MGDRYNSNISNTDSELLDIANSQVRDRAKLIILTDVNKRGYKASFSESGVYWTCWIIVIDQSLIFITYNSDLKSLKMDEVNSAQVLVDGLSST